MSTLGPPFDLLVDPLSRRQAEVVEAVGNRSLPYTAGYGRTRCGSPTTESD